MITKNYFKRSFLILLLLPIFFAQAAVVFVAAPGGGMPAQVNAGQVLSLHYQLTTTNYFPTQYKINLTLSPAFQVDFTSSTCNLTGAAASLPAKGSCDIYLKFTALTTPGTYEFSMGYAYTSEPTPTYWTIKTKVVNPTPPPPTAVSATVTVAGDLVTQQAGASLAGTVTLTNTSTQKTYSSTTVTAIATPQNFPNAQTQMNTGSYSVSAPASVSAGGDTYYLQKVGSVSITTAHPNFTLTYNLAPTQTVQATVTVTGDLFTQHPGTSLGGAVTITNYTTQQQYSNSSLTASADQPFPAASTEIYTGTYSVTAPSTVTVGGTIYQLQPPKPATITTNSSNIGLVYNVKPTPGTVYDWHQSHLQAIVNANVAGIFWGGGSTTSVVQISSNPVPNQWLVTKIAAYESNNPGTTMPVLSTAHVQGFPSYLAMGTVSEFSTTVTDQLKEQSLDMTNHYEGNGDANAGCFWEQQNANGATGGLQVDYFYRANQAAGTNAFNWKNGDNTIPAGTYRITGDYFIHPTGHKSDYQQYTAKIGTPQISGATMTIPVTYYALPKVNTSNANPNIADTQLVTLTQATTVFTTVTYPPGVTPPAAPGVTPTSDINLASNMCGSYYYQWGGYTPQIDNIAAQAAEVKTATGHSIVAGNVLYTTRFSDGGTEIQDDIQNELSVTTAFYNLMYEAYKMQSYAGATTNAVPMVLLLNPDSTWLFQNCGESYCQLAWKPGITQDPTAVLLQNSQMQAAIQAALDRMHTRGYLGDSLYNTMTTQLPNILTPTGGRTIPGIPEYILAVNWVVTSIAPNVPFGNGNNIYDSANPLLLPSPGANQAPWETAAATWIHLVNHLPSTVPGTVAEHIDFEAQRYANYLKDMNFVGNAQGQYKPSFLYFDKYERDEFESIKTGSSVVPQGTYINGSYEFNGVDWDSYLLYMKNIDGYVGNIPLFLWQMPGGSLQTDSSYACSPLPAKPGTSICYGSSTATWVFGDPDLHNDMSNLSSQLALASYQLTPFSINSLYFVSNSGVVNAAEYLTLAAGAP